MLGIIFTCVQAWEYAHAPFAFSNSIYGATFFMATGFHGAHVIIGTIFLIVCLVRAYAGQFTPQQHLGFEFAAWYWHFVDVVWLFLFSCIYVWGSWGATIEGVDSSVTLDRGAGGGLRGFAGPRIGVAGMAEERRYPPISAVSTGLAGRCPRCGDGRSVPGLPDRRAQVRRLRPRLRLRRFRRGPAVFVTLIAGFFVLGVGAGDRHGLRAADLGLSRWSSCR